MSVARFERRHLRHVGIEHADRAIERRARVVPDRAFAGDLDLRQVAALYRRIEGELLGLRIELDDGAAHGAVRDPHIVVLIRPDVIRLGEGYRHLVFDHLAGRRIELADLAVAEHAVPDDPVLIDAAAPDQAELIFLIRREHRIFREYFLLGIEFRHPALRELRDPDVALLVLVGTVGIGAQRRRLIERNLAGLGIVLGEPVAPDDRQPDIILGVDDRIVTAGLEQSGRIDGIAVHLAGLGIKAAELGPDRLAPPDDALGIDRNAVRDAALRQRVGLPLHRARIELDDAIARPAVGHPDVAVVVEIWVLADR